MAANDMQAVAKHAVFFVQSTISEYDRKDACINLEDLSPELREKALACNTPEEILALAQTEGRELSDDELEAIAGGEEKWQSIQCPRCKSWDVEECISLAGTPFYMCHSCDNRWTYY